MLPQPLRLGENLDPNAAKGAERFAVNASHDGVLTHVAVGTSEDM